jgi:glutamate racemase
MKIVVFDSGFGSLSVIKEIQKKIKSDIIYFADQKNFPYGKKSRKQLLEIINQSLDNISKKFNPDLIVLASNTPSLLLRDKLPQGIINVLPPLGKISASKQSHNIAILATESVVKGSEIDAYIKEKIKSRKHRIIKINSSSLVNLVETGKFIDKPEYCSTIIQKTLKKKFQQHKIDVATLSSTHLPFLLPFLKDAFPNVRFLDPAMIVAQKISRRNVTSKNLKNRLQIFTTGDAKKFQSKLKKIGIRNKVTSFSC